MKVLLFLRIFRIYEAQKRKERKNNFMEIKNKLKFGWGGGGNVGKYTRKQAIL